MGNISALVLHHLILTCLLSLTSTSDSEAGQLPDFQFSEKLKILQEKWFYFKQNFEGGGIFQML